eukprot:EG_transcript_5368
MAVPDSRLVAAAAAAAVVLVLSAALWLTSAGGRGSELHALPAAMHRKVAPPLGLPSHSARGAASDSALRSGPTGPHSGLVVAPRHTESSPQAPESLAWASALFGLGFVGASSWLGFLLLRTSQLQPPMAMAATGDSDAGLDEELKARLDRLVQDNNIVLFMKGSRMYPQCGFSRTAVQLLDSLGAVYETVDVLADPAIREGVKVYSEWPTIPQLYINGDFIGGCDIMVEMYQAGELQELVAVPVRRASSVPQVLLQASPKKASGSHMAAFSCSEAMALRVFLWPPTSALRQPLQALGAVVAAADSLIALWQATANTAPEGVEVAVVDAGGDTAVAGATVSYALFRRQLPVLLLRPAGHPASPLEGLQSDLLTVATYADAAAALKHCQEFLTFPETPGRIFTFEGGDGAGKQTQTEMLVARLRAEGYPVRTLDFPHDHAMYGALIRELLAGKHGKMSEVNPLLFASIYAFNRLDTAPRLHYWLRRGHNVVLDRYSSANWGHQASKYESDEDRLQVIETLRKFEHQWLGLPTSFRVLYLDLPPRFAWQALQSDTKRATLDIHETATLQYKNRVRETFLWCCEQFPEWVAVPCVTEAAAEGQAGTRRTREELHEDIYRLLHPFFVK